MGVFKPFMFSAQYGLAEEGSYLLATNPTPGTAFAYSITTAFSDTTPFAYLQNSDVKGDPAGRNIYVDYLKLIVTTVPATTTAIFYALILDGLRTFGTDNTTVVTPVCPNGNTTPRNANSNVTPLIKFQNSATPSVVSASSSSKRIVARGALGGLPVVGDEIVALFGTPNAGAQTATTAAEGAGQPGRRVSNAPPIVVGPQQGLMIHLWLPGNATTGLSYEFELGLWAR